MEMEPQDPFAQLHHLFGPQIDEFKALEKRHDEMEIKIEKHYQAAFQELKLKCQVALDTEQRSFVQSKQEFKEEFLRKFISTFGVDTVQKCLGDVCLTASENTLSTTSDSPPIMVSMPRVSLPQVLCN